jgi:hypothetical protein
MTTPTSEDSGPSSQLISRIHHLQSLLENLPANLPLNPVESTYHFGLDAEPVEDEGVWYAFNRSLEVCFETHKLQKGGAIVFRERGTRYKDLIKTIKAAVVTDPH